MTRYVNIFNGHSEVVRPQACFLWCLLFGPFFFIIKGIWSHALISFVAAICTLGLSVIIYPFFASAIVKGSYLKRGWVQCDLSMAYSRGQGAVHHHRLREGRREVSRDSYGRISNWG